MISVFRNMTKKKRIFIGIIFCPVIMILIGFIVLEILSRTCPVVKTEYPSCVFLIEKHVADIDWVEILNGFIRPSPLGEDLETVIATRVFEVDRSEIKGLNGIACSRYAFVSKDLPSAAKRYVKVHESLHLLGSQNETETNWQAAKREPWGMVETVGYTVGLNIRKGSITQLPCRAVGMWNSFKKYFMNK